MVNKQQPNKPHGHDVPCKVVTANAWPFPTKDNPLKPWTPKEVQEYEKLQRQNAQESPL